MFQKVVTSALIAGFGAGLIAALLQFAFVQPILLHAELFETGALTHFGNGQTQAHVATEIAADLTRDGLSVIFSALTYCGYALILMSLAALAQERGHAFSARTGLIWGICGFIAAQLAPSFGLAPELPGMSAGELEARQIWWYATVILTGAGIWMIAFGRNWTMWGIAIALLAAPHVIGAPSADVLTGPAPPELAAEFASRALTVGLVAWCCLGLFLGALWTNQDKAGAA
ncbi:cobalt transporter subunit CbtA [Yoonia tamlensis]|uniref:Cobalt transporter subunit CbtA n=1 Tax=Yoonia tamlensis TaxID=390270 RepID=A0A1I6FPB5_9RHOB|nr:CbtA family protein [Yoonia tamlensis]SFR31792.1 cobalt transporter subunit CbtA [Yoonia tamlensis]